MERFESGDENDAEWKGISEKQGKTGRAAENFGEEVLLSLFLYCMFKALRISSQISSALLPSVATVMSATDS